MLSGKGREEDSGSLDQRRKNTEQCEEEDTRNWKARGLSRVTMCDSVRGAGKLCGGLYLILDTGNLITAILSFSHNDGFLCHNLKITLNSSDIVFLPKHHFLANSDYPYVFLFTFMFTRLNLQLCYCH